LVQKGIKAAELEIGKAVNEKALEGGLEVGPRGTKETTNGQEQVVVRKPLELPVLVELLGKEDTLQKINLGQLSKNAANIVAEGITTGKRRFMGFAGTKKTGGGLALGHNVKGKGKTLDIAPCFKVTNHGFEQFAVLFGSLCKATTTGSVKLGIVVGRTPGRKEFRCKGDQVH
jgi:hypothetical protein